MPSPERPKRIDNEGVSAFLRTKLGYSPRSASTATYALMLRLLDRPDIIAFCSKCHKQRGACRCPEYGYEIAGKWFYRSNTSSWQIDVNWLLGLDAGSRELTVYLGPAAAPRLQLLIVYLNGLSPA